ncbi:LuxR C-terminal-related transcriptional regulator [Pseudoflavitalea rhizosphaerae]|uniref:LuxR C-terminal-related transcriptional regulator n=1 Tax=Pseudoflavitalea rhizosphaerae TaxID=1884793 RepID=UPI000F8EEFC6|nr:LuxR C-terminal-related transcriptional regulator [Pseudoflavitalea rhizosphaerae]
MNLSECFLFLSAEVPATMGASKIINENFHRSTFFSASSVARFTELFMQKREMLSMCLIDFETDLYEEFTIQTAEYILNFPGISFIYFIRPKIPNRIVAKLEQIGVKGLLLKTATAKLIIHCIKEVLQGRPFIQKEIANQIKEIRKSTPQKESHLFNPFLSLSKQEAKVINGILAGKRIKEISNELGITSSSVSTYFVRGRNRLGVINRIELIQLANKIKSEIKGDLFEDLDSINN